MCATHLRPVIARAALCGDKRVGTEKLRVCVCVCVMSKSERATKRERATHLPNRRCRADGGAGARLEIDAHGAGNVTAWERESVREGDGERGER